VASSLKWRAKEATDGAEGINDGPAEVKGPFLKCIEPVAALYMAGSAKYGDPRVMLSIDAFNLPNIFMGIEVVIP